MTPPFSIRAMHGLLNLLDTHLHTSIAVEGPEAEALQTLGLLHDGRLPDEETLLRITGEHLFDALFPASPVQDEDVRGALEIALNQSRQNDQSLPFQLRLDSYAVDIASLPWELIRDKSGPLVASGQLRFSRYITFAQSTTRFTVADRLNVLVVAPRPNQVAHLDASLESQAIHRALDELNQRGLIHVVVLNDPTYAGLVQALNHSPYHILHFDGHGGYVVRCPSCDRLQPAKRATCTYCGRSLVDAQPQGCLVFEGEDAERQPHYVKAEEFAVALAKRHIRLCVISACQSTTLKGASVFNSVGPKLIQGGMPAVVGMQFTVMANHAARFVEAFYSGLAQQKSVVAATDAARRLLYTEGVWYIPTTYLRSEDGEGNFFRFQEAAHGLHQRLFSVDPQGTGVYLLPAGQSLPDWAQTFIHGMCPYKRLRPFALQDKAIFFGRIAEVATLLAAVIDPDRSFAVLLGAAGVGKTSLLHAGLIPELLRHSYLTLTIRGDGDPLNKLRQALTSSHKVDVDLSTAVDLPGLVDILLQSLERPLLIAFDDFDEYLARATLADVHAFVEQVAHCVEQSYPLPVRFLFVVREDHQSQLGVFQECVPSIFDEPVFLRPFSQQAAEQAMTQPLVVCKLPVVYDATFLIRTLLPELAASPNDATDDSQQAAINPTYLQIVADDLLQAALHALPSLQQGTMFVIGEALYAQRRTAAILNSYLDQKLSEHFPNPANLQSARSLLKQMVMPDGDRIFQSKKQMATHAGMDELHAGEFLSILEKDGLLEARLAADRTIEYSIGHRFLAQQVRAWSDPQETLRRCAQDVLNQGWHAWRARWQIAQQQAQEPLVDVQELLIGADHLYDIRRTQEQAAMLGYAPLTINPVHSCLLLRSAVHHRIDMSYWAQAIHHDAKTVSILAQIEGGVGEQSAIEDIALCRAVLGLPQHAQQSHDLARAAMNDANGDVRHTAALALAAQGVDAMIDALPQLCAATPRGRFWRPTQALAQIRASDLALPGLGLTRHWLVVLWATCIKAWDNRWEILVEGAPAGLGAGVGLFLALMSIGLMQADANSARLYLLLGLFALPLGFVAGVFAVAGAWLCDLGGRTRSRLRRVLGFSIGFMASIVATWMPVAVATALLGGRFAELARSILMRHVVGGFLWGCGIAVGALLFGAVFPRSWFWKTLMGGVGGVATCLFATVWGVDIPFLPATSAPSTLWSTYLAAVLLGLWVGAGLIGGWLAGQRIWRHSRSAAVHAAG